jgi:serine protease Do
LGNFANLSLSLSQGSIANNLLTLEVGGHLRDFIASDITIASGSSGGALLNIYGHLIGITTLRLKDELGNVIYGYGYSIPLKVIEEFYNNYC